MLVRRSGQPDSRIYHWSFVCRGKTPLMVRLEAPWVVDRPYVVPIVHNWCLAEPPGKGVVAHVDMGCSCIVRLSSV